MPKMQYNGAVSKSQKRAILRFIEEHKRTNEKNPAPTIDTTKVERADSRDSQATQEA